MNQLSSCCNAEIKNVPNGRTYQELCSKCGKDIQLQRTYDMMNEVVINPTLPNSGEVDTTKMSLEMILQANFLTPAQQEKAITRLIRQAELRGQRKQDKKRLANDIKFLTEMKKRVENALNDTTEMDYLKTMVNDWLAELQAQLTSKEAHATDD